MDYKYIEQLLERYWNCETSLEEEQILRSFFHQKEIPAHLLRYKAMFAYQEIEKERLPPLDQNPIFTYTNLRTQKSVNLYFKKCLDKDQKMCYYIIKKSKGGKQPIWVKSFTTEILKIK